MALMQINRHKTRKIWVGDRAIGGDAPVSVQSMTNTKTADVAATVRQIQELTDAGCDIVRVAVPDKAAAEAIGDIKRQIRIPLVADIHFDYRLALIALEQGIDKVRINPGNIGELERVKAVVNAAKERQVPIRIGVNGGSLETELLQSYGGVCPEALVESAMRHVRILQDLDFQDMVISIKCSDVALSVAAYRQLANRIDAPLHTGITEAGTIWRGTIKSAMGIGALLLDGIGDTIRVSLTGNPVEEIRAGREILKACGLDNRGITFVSCPTCGRTEINLIDIAERVEAALGDIDVPLKVAVMGCVVNGPGEARDADIGIAGGKGCAMLFRKGEILRRVEEGDIVTALVEEVRKILELAPTSQGNAD